MLKCKRIIGSIILLGCCLSLWGQVNVKRTLRETKHQIYYASYSPDGKFIATTGSDNNIIIWNAETGIIYRTLVGLKKRPNRLVFPGNGEHLYSAGEDGLITVWDPVSLEMLNTASGHSGTIKALAISPDGVYLASAGEDKVLRVWAIAEHKLILVYELKGHKKAITSLKFSPDSKRLVSGGSDKLLMLWDVATGNNLVKIPAHDGWIRCVEISPDGRFVASGGDDNLIKIWNATDLSALKTLEGHTDWVQTLDYSPSGKYIISGGHDHYIRAWDVELAEEAFRSPKMEQIVLSVDASPVSGDFISSCLLSEELRIWAYGFDKELQAGKEEPGQGETDQPVIPVVHSAGEEQGTLEDPGNPVITLFSPEPLNGEVVHDQASILIIGKVEDPGGVQTMLINRQRIPLSETGIFQLDYALNSGENQMDLVAVSNKGKMTRNKFTITCTRLSLLLYADIINR